MFHPYTISRMMRRHRSRQIHDRALTRWIQQVWSSAFEPGNTFQSMILPLDSPLFLSIAGIANLAICTILLILISKPFVHASIST
jgi:hypothetical protein